MSDAQQPPEVQNETGSDSASVTIDLTGELDPALLLLEVRNAFVLFREEVRRELRSVKADTEFTRKYMKTLGLRLTALEQDKEQIEEEVRVLASGTPPPFTFNPSSDEVLP